MNNEIRKLQEQIRLQGDVMKYLFILNARLLAGVTDREQIAAALEAEKLTPIGMRITPMLDQMLEAIRQS